jgi:hypothetical protein
LPDFDVIYCGAGTFDDACGLVPEQHGDRPDAVTVDDRQIRMTQSRGLDADEQFMLTRWSEIEFSDGQRPRLSVTAGCSDAFEDRSAGSHDELPFTFERMHA